MPTLTGEPDTVTFGKWLKERRKARKLTQEELADKVECSKTYISNLERDAPHSNTGVPVTPSPKMQRALAEALRVDLGEVMAALFPDVRPTEQPEYAGAADNFAGGLTAEQEEIVRNLIDRFRKDNEGG